MWFLLLQIVFLLVIAALLGAGAGYWWFRRRYEDVTEQHEELRLQSGKLGSFEKLATSDDVRIAVERLTSRFSELRIPDMAPVLARLEQMEQVIGDIRIPEPDMGAVHQRLAGMDENVRQRLVGIEDMVRGWRAPEVDLAPVSSGIASVQAAVDQLKAGAGDMDTLAQMMSGLETRVAQLGQQIEARGGDGAATLRRLEQLEARLAQFAEHLDGTRKAGVDAVLARLGEVSLAVGSIRMPELEPQLAPVRAKLESVESIVRNFHVPPTDLQPVQSALAAIDLSLATIDRRPVDLEPLHARLARLESGLTLLQTQAEGRRVLEPVERRLASLQEAMAGMKDADLEPVIGAVMESRQDLAAVENRITAIEYSLAALHHMLRARPELARSDAWQPRPVPSTKEKPAAPVRPARENDPINAVRRQDDQANLLVEAAFGPADDLELINGVGPILSSMLHEIGVHYFWQVAEWTPEEAAWVDGQLMHFRGRIKRDDWVSHARQLAALPASAKRPVAANSGR